jgi:hypothetical protein
MQSCLSSGVRGRGVISGSSFAATTDDFCFFAAADLCFFIATDDLCFAATDDFATAEDLCFATADEAATTHDAASKDSTANTQELRGMIGTLAANHGAQLPIINRAKIRREKFHRYYNA